MKRANEYKDSKVKKPYDHIYFKTKEPHRYKYFIIKKLNKDIQSNHNFKYLVIADKLLKILEQTNYTLKKSCI